VTGVAKDVAKGPSSPVGLALRRGVKDVGRWLRSPKNSKPVSFEDREFDDVMSPTKGQVYGKSSEEERAMWVSFLKRLGSERVDRDEAVAAYRALENGKFTQNTLRQELLKNGLPPNAVKRLPFGRVNVFEFLKAYT
jgi:hypothetical protein